MNEENNQQVVKDMGDSFNQRLNTIMIELDQCKKMLLEEPIYILALNERLHTMFLHLSGKMVLNKLNEDLEKQKDFQKRSRDLRPVCAESKGQYHMTYTGRYIRGNDYSTYVSLLEEREIHLRYVLELLGLTNVQQKPSDKYYEGVR